MKGKINKLGRLEIQRGGKWKCQHCPYMEYYDSVPADCGDWCPMFGEPDSGRWKDKVMLQICNGTLWFDAFNDERAMKEDS